MFKRRLEPDLLLIDALTLTLLIIVFTLPVPWLRLILGFPFIFLFPGYVLVAALFPGKESLGVTTRLALSLGLSAAASIFIGLMLNFTPWGISVYPLLLSISLFILITSGVAWYLRGKLSSQERFNVNLNQSLASLSQCVKTADKRYRSLVVIILCVIIGAAGTSGYIITKPSIRQPFTEFYILGIEGKAGNYPQELRQGEEGTVIVGIINHQPEEITYRLEIMVGEDKLYELSPIQLKFEEKWQGQVGFIPEKIGNSQKVDFRLYKAGGQSYETRYLWVDIKP